ARRAGRRDGPRAGKSCSERDDPHRPDRGGRVDARPGSRKGPGSHSGPCPGPGTGRDVRTSSSRAGRGRRLRTAHGPGRCPAASLATALSSFIGTNPNGDWKLYVVDDAAGDTGSIRDGWTLDVETTTQVCNGASFTVPAGAPGTTSGPASLYPSSIAVSGLP